MAIPTYDWIAHYASTRGDCVAMEDLATGRSFTYAEFHRRVDRVAAGLRARFGVARGDRVAVLAHNSSDLFELQFACARIGAIFAPMNWRLTTPELRFIASDWLRGGTGAYSPEMMEFFRLEGVSISFTGASAFVGRLTTAR